MLYIFPGWVQNVIIAIRRNIYNILIDIPQDQQNVFKFTKIASSKVRQIGVKEKRYKTP